MKKVDESGYWIIKANPISRVGVFDYLGKQIDLNHDLGLEPNRVYKVYRSADELFCPEALESMDGIPFIDEHEMLGENWTPVEKRPPQGTITNIRRSLDNGETLLADIKIYTDTMKDKIASGKKGLSLGYYCKYEPEPGFYKGQTYDFVQKNIRGNHISLVARPRNDVFVCDSASGDVLAFDSLPEEITNMKDENEKSSVKDLQKKLEKIILDKDEEACAALSKFLDRFLDKREKEKPKKDTEAESNNVWDTWLNECEIKEPEPPPKSKPTEPEPKDEPKDAPEQSPAPSPEKEAAPAESDAPAPEEKSALAGEGELPSEEENSPSPDPAKDCKGTGKGKKKACEKPPCAEDKGKSKPCEGEACAKTALDEAIVRKQYFKEFSRARELADKISDLTGTFDAAELTEQEIAIYGCQKLGVAFDESIPESAVFAIKAALKFAEQKPRTTVTLDSAVHAKTADAQAQTNKCFEAYFRN